MQEDRNLFNQDFRAATGWSIISGKMKLGPGGFPGFNCCRPQSRESKAKDTMVETEGDKLSISV